MNDDLVQRMLEASERDVEKMTGHIKEFRELIAEFNPYPDRFNGVMERTEYADPKGPQ